MLRIAIAALHTTVSAAAYDSAARPDPAQRLLEDALERSGVPGITAAVISAEGELTAYAAGFRDIARTERMPTTARMMAGSAGKTFAAAIVWRLIETGKASPDDPIARWLGDEPWFDRLPNHGTITLGMLMDHTSGIMDHVREPAFAAAIEADPQRAWAPAELLAFILDREPLHPAGERFSYADTNYILVGLIIEAITGEDFYGLAQRELIEPLALKNTVPQTQAAIPGLIEGVDAIGLFGMPDVVARESVYAINPQWEWCGGGWVSTSTDLAVWIRAYTDGTVLAPASLAAMRSGIDADTGPGDRYGPGLMITRSPAGEAVGHLGFMPGYVTLALRYSELGVTVAVQINESSRASLGVLRPLAAELALSASGRGGEDEAASPSVHPAIGGAGRAPTATPRRSTASLPASRASRRSRRAPP